MDSTNTETTVTTGKKGFKVGVNEGVLITKSQLKRDFDLYTEGLSGCVAIVITNRNYVFMAHVSGASDPTTLEKRAENYLKTVAKLINDKEYIDVHLTANTLSDSTVEMSVNQTLEAFKTASTTLFELNMEERTDNTTSTCVSINEDEEIEHNREPSESYTNARMPSTLRRMINADQFGFGAAVPPDDPSIPKEHTTSRLSITPQSTNQLSTQTQPQSSSSAFTSSSTPTTSDSTSQQTTSSSVSIERLVHGWKDQVQRQNRAITETTHAPTTNTTTTATGEQEQVPHPGT